MDLLINLSLRENSLPKLILFFIKNPSLLSPCIPVVKMASPGLQAFLLNSSSPCIPKAVIEIIYPSLRELFEDPQQFQKEEQLAFSTFVNLDQ